MPGSYYALPHGEKVLVRAFFEKEIEDRLKKN